MSDGNFNRSLLPHTPYQSGLKAGKSMARMHALKVFDELLAQEFPQLDSPTLSRLKEEFRLRLSRSL